MTCPDSRLAGQDASGNPLKALVRLSGRKGCLGCSLGPAGVGGPLGELHCACDLEQLPGARGGPPTAVRPPPADSGFPAPAQGSRLPLTTVMLGVFRGACRP